jgi:methylated-DNA-[protein]-cysteine S-methyltransferase
MNLFLDAFASPIGPLTLASNGCALVALTFGAPPDALARSLRARFGPDAAISDAADPQGFTGRLRAYFAGEIAALSELPVDGGGTPFQRRVWAALQRIPAGETISYSALAATIGAPRATRAVGLANGQNPIAVVVPCHRVIGANGSLTGYGGGLERKRWLIEHERASVGTGGSLASAARPPREVPGRFAPNEAPRVS